MGFNFSVAREVDGKLIRDRSAIAEKTHATTCSHPCMCDFGIDTCRFAGDQDFYYALHDIPHETRVWDDDAYYRPVNFAQAREVARSVVPWEKNQERLLRVLDTLEDDPTLWIGGSS